MHGSCQRPGPMTTPVFQGVLPKRRRLPHLPPIKTLVFAPDPGYFYFARLRNQKFRFHSTDKYVDSFNKGKKSIHHCHSSIHTVRYTVRHTHTHTMSKVAHSQAGCGSSDCACKAASSSATVKLPKTSKHATHQVWGIDHGNDTESTGLIHNKTNNGHGNGYGSTRGHQESLDFNALLQPGQPGSSSLQDKCDRPGGSCCKDEVVEERKLIDPDVVRDM